MLRVCILVLTCIVGGLLFTVLSVTQECRWAILRNCRRLDGSWSSARMRREWKAFVDYVFSLSVPLLFVMTISLVAGQYVVENLMPAGQIVDAFSTYSPNTAQWRSGLESVREEHLGWLEKNGVSAADATAFQRSLWYDWPFLAVLVISLAVLGLWTIFGASRRAVSDYVVGIRTRREGYAGQDVSRMMQHSPEWTFQDGERS